MAKSEIEGHDWDLQYEDTAWVLDDLRAKGVDFGCPYKLDIQFVPSTSTADGDGFAEALRAAGYDVKGYRDNPTMEATTSPIVLTLESVWQHERRATEIALRYGFNPDGWGFWED